MELIIEFSNNYIDITEQRVNHGKLYVQKNIRGKMPEGAFANGIIINTNGVAQSLKEIIKENQIRSKKAVLCINGMDIIRKEVRIPRGSEKHVNGLLENELHKAEALKGGYIFDYIPADMETESEIVKKNYQNYSVYLLPEDLIKNYQTTMKRAGLNLLGVLPVSHSMERLAGLLGLKKKTGLTILVSAEDTMINLLMAGAGIKNVHQSLEIKEENAMEENMFIVSAVRQIQSFTSQEEQVLEGIAENISKLVQFQSQSNAQSAVERILIYGSQVDQEDFIKRVESRCGIPTKRCELPTEKIDMRQSEKQAFYGYNGIGANCGKMMGIKKELSFLNLQGSNIYVSFKERLPLLVGLGCTLLLAIFYGGIVLLNNGLQMQVKDYEQKNARIEKEPEYIRKKELQKQLVSINEYNDNCLICIDLMEQNDRLTPETFSTIDDLILPDITIMSYGYENHTVTIQCTSTDQDGPARFAKILSNAGLFEQVKYSGFAAAEDENGVSKYTFSLECSK